ncbi:MAG TPA: exonuclease domain-containing protein [Ktedonobacterales bacterium]|nr:exonuclease domain-containing protein [Ktedonobacterales bacterium]
MATRKAEREPGADVRDDTGDVAAEAPAPSSALLRRARNRLVEAGGPLSPSDLARAVFGAQGALAASDPWVGMLDKLLDASPLFSRDERDGLWRLSAWEIARRPLSEIEFAAVDVETTGLAPGRHRLIEVGAVIVTAAGELTSFRRLINPDRKIPQFITHFTGITESMVARSARAATVLPKLRDFIGERPIVGHNVGFDLSFLNAEADRCGMGAAFFPETGIDTISLARRYVTGMRRASLDRVALALHVPVHTRHRALPDARLTAQIFALLLARAREEGCETLEDLWRVSDGVAPTRFSQPEPRPTGKIYLNPAWRQNFPTTPGVYLMRDASGEVIYVGKAKRLRDRLASYYSQPLGYTRKMDGLLQSVVEIETRQLGSELEALLVESQLIKSYQPRYNVQLKNHERYPFIKVNLNSSFPRFYATREIAADGARYFGPFRSGRIVEVTLELIHKVLPIRTCLRSLPPDAPPSEPCLRYHLKRCPAPCKGLLSPEAQREYRAATLEACAFLGGERDDLIARLKREMFEASARQDYERAARLRDALRDADQVLLGQRLVTGAVEANNLLIAYPSAVAGFVELYLIRHGRLARQRRVERAPDAIESAARELASEAAALGAPPPCVGRNEVDQINIIARWISHHSDESDRAFFNLPRALDDPAEIATFSTRVAATMMAEPEVETLLEAGGAPIGASDSEEEMF